MSIREFRETPLSELLSGKTHYYCTNTECKNHKNNYKE